jgi:hypothetical protein
MLVTLPDSFQLAMVVFEGYEMVVGEWNSGFRDSAGRRRRRLSKGPVGDCKGYVACLALGWEKAGAGVGATAAGTHKARSAIEAGQGKSRGAGRGREIDRVWESSRLKVRSRHAF